MDLFVLVLSIFETWRCNNKVITKNRFEKCLSIHKVLQFTSVFLFAERQQKQFANSHFSPRKVHFDALQSFFILKIFVKRSSTTWRLRREFARMNGWEQKGFYFCTSSLVAHSCNQKCLHRMNWHGVGRRQTFSLCQKKILYTNRRQLK